VDRLDIPLGSFDSGMRTVLADYGAATGITVADRLAAGLKSWRRSVVRSPPRGTWAQGHTVTRLDTLCEAEAWILAKAPAGSYRCQEMAGESTGAHQGLIAQHFDVSPQIATSSRGMWHASYKSQVLQAHVDFFFAAVRQRNRSFSIVRSTA